MVGLPKHRPNLRGPVSLWATTLWLCTAAVASAAVPLDSLVAEALANNAELKTLEAGVEEARGQRTQAGFFRNPEVSVEVGGREVRDSENILQGNGTTFSIAVMQTFEFPGKGTLRKAIADKNLEVAELGLGQFRLALAGQVRLLAIEHAAAAAEAAAAEAVRRQSAELTARLSAQTAFGARQALEIRLVQAGLVDLAGAIKKASLRREETRAQLNTLLGRPQHSPLPPIGVAAPPARGFDENALALSAQKNSILLRIRKCELERSARELAATRLDITPDFAIGPFFSRDVAGDTEQNAGAAISATVPLWDWNIGNIQSARARQAAAAALRVKGEREIEARILGLLKAHELNRRQLEMIPPGLVKNLQESSGLADSQFRSGAIGATLYLDAQSAYLNCLRASHEAVLDAWRTYLDIDLLTGGQFDAAGSATPAKQKKNSRP